MCAYKVRLIRGEGRCTRITSPTPNVERKLEAAYQRWAHHLSTPVTLLWPGIVLNIPNNQNAFVYVFRPFAQRMFLPLMRIERRSGLGVELVRNVSSSQSP